MRNLEKAKNLITKANNIGILPSEKKEESIPAALALFYSLKKLKKNVNLLIEEVPEKFHFLVPSIKSVSSPRKFMLSVKNPNKAEISEVSYEKNERVLNFYITAKKGYLEKNSVSFRVFSQENDLLIIIGIDDFKKNDFSKNHINTSNDFSVLSINNIDKYFNHDNLINISSNDASLSELTAEFLKSSKIKITKNAANCLLAGLIFSSDNFRDSKTSQKSFELAASLKEKGACQQKIVNRLYKPSVAFKTDFSNF